MSTLTKIISRWGLLKGIRFYYQVNRNKKENWSLPELKHPVYLRPHTSDNLVFKQIFGMGEYDIGFPFEPKTIIDGGANIGLFAVLMANRYPHARIISVEPDRGNYEQLVKNTAVYPNITPLHAGLWHQRARLKIVDEAADEWGLQVKESHDENDLRAITINELMETCSLENPDIVKLDVEGAEEAIFSDNYRHWMERTKILIIELHDKYWPGTGDNFRRAIAEFPHRQTRHGEYMIYTLTGPLEYNSINSESSNRT